MIFGLPWWWTVIYLVAGLHVGRVFGGFAMWDEVKEGCDPSGADKACGLLGFLIGTVAWPAFVIGRLWALHGEWFVRTPPKVVASRKQVEKDRMKRAVVADERQLEVGEEHGGGLAVILPPERGIAQHVSVKSYEPDLRDEYHSDKGAP